MVDDGLVDLIGGLTQLAATHSATIGDLADIAKAQRRRVEELAASLDEAVAELGEATRTARLILNMKAATLTMACAKCGAEYAKEEGPELCGPCWVAAGRPGTIGLHVV